MKTEIKIDEFGNKTWYKDGLIHRDDGPAFEGKCGDRFWYKNGQYHRVDGPALMFKAGAKLWYQNGLRHRENGPAIEFTEDVEYYYRGRQIKCSSIEEFNRIIKLIAFW